MHYGTVQKIFSEITFAGFKQTIQVFSFNAIVFLFQKLRAKPGLDIEYGTFHQVHPS